MALSCLLRRTYDPTSLFAAHPPRLRHRHKRLVFDLASPPGARHTGPLVVTRWAPLALPATVELADTELVVHPGTYGYQGASEGVWHVNFADPQLFVAYGSPLLAQDEIQAAEHPVLGSVRESLLAEGAAALTEEAGQPTPVLVMGAERRCAIDTRPSPDEGRFDGLYGNRFSSATPAQVTSAIRVLDPPTRTNLIAIAAPCANGAYTRTQIERIATTAYTGFAAAVAESRRAWPGMRVEVHTGFWGCGAFGGSRPAMTLLQLLAARIAGVDRLQFYAFDDGGLEAYRAGAADLASVLAAGRPAEPLDSLIDRVTALGYQWGVSDGN